MQWTPDSKAVLYSIEHNGSKVIMKQSLEGGPTEAIHEEVVDFGGDELFDFGYSFDGQSLAVNRGSWQHDLVLISGLGSR